MRQIGRTVAEMALEWGVDESTVRRWCRQGHVVAQRVGRDWLVFSDERPELTPGRPRKVLVNLPASG